MYDYPKGHPKHPDTKAPKSYPWVRILGHWRELSFDFQRLLHTDLVAVMGVQSWRWFDEQVSGVLALPDSLLASALRIEDHADSDGGEA